MNKNIQLPDYNRSILSVSSSIMKYYNVKSNYKSLIELDNVLKKKYQNVVFIILDCVGKNIVEKNLDKDSIIRKNLLTNVTTVFPSTTVAATTAFHSCLSPLESGWIGWMPYVKKYNHIIELFTGVDYYTRKKIINNPPDEDLRYETIYEKISKANSDVRIHQCFPKFAEGGSKTFEELCHKIETICSGKGKNLISAYWDNTDKTIHENGTNNLAIKKALKNIDDNINKLSKKLTNTIIIISSDHGAIDLKEVYIDEIPEINECLLMPPTIESRFISFFIKNGMKTKFKNAIEKQFHGKYKMYTKKQFLKTGLLGHGNIHKTIEDYLGDYILIMNSDLSIRYHGTGKIKKHLADHSGITKEEMLVPVVAIECNNKK
jgi:predicted AlkP superfamily pyrophosphatase or phosphodiesterase